MCSIVHQILQHQLESTVLDSSSEILASQDNLPNIRDIISVISDDKCLAIFGVIAELSNTGADSHIVRIKLSLSNKEYCHRLAALIQSGLIIRKDVNNKYILTSLGKVVHTNLLSIQYMLGNIWKFRAIDAVRISDNKIYENVDKIASGLTDILVGEEQIKEILKK
jgi:predicted transcriptional regulator